MIISDDKDLLRLWVLKGRNNFGGAALTKPKTIAIIAVFAALTVALNLSPIKFPAPFAPFLIYQIWEVPIVTAFLIHGPTVAIMISFINTIALLIVFPGALPTGPFYNLAAVLSMLLGIYIFERGVINRLRGKGERFQIASSSLLGIVSRVGIMTIVNAIFLPLPPPIGFDMPMSAVIAILPLIGLFNGTLALYTIPLGYFLQKAVCSALKIQRWGSPAADS